MRLPEAPLFHVDWWVDPCSKVYPSTRSNWLTSRRSSRADQHLGSTNFQVVVNTRAAALKLREAGSVSFANQLVPIVPTGPQVSNVTCLFLPTFVRNDQLAEALAPYGKVTDDCHVRAQCTTGYCDPCGVFGHLTEGCPANCRRSGGTHVTVDCTAKRSYSSIVVGNYATDFPALDPGNASSPIAPEAPTALPVCTVAPPSPPDAATAAFPPPPPSPPPPAPPEPSPTGSGVTSAEATEFVRGAAVVVGDIAYAVWSPASGDGEVSSNSDHLVIDENPAPGGPAATPTDSMDTTTTDTPDCKPSRPPHEDSKRPVTSSGSRSPDSGSPRATRLYGNTISKCEQYWNSSNRPKSAEIVASVLGRQLATPCVARWSSLYHALVALLENKSQLRILSERLDLVAFRDAELEFLEEYRDILYPIATAKQTEVMHFARAQNCDLLCFQDTNFSHFRDVPDFEARFSVTAFFSYAQRRVTGVGVVVYNRSLLRNATYQVLRRTEGLYGLTFVA
ncbi:hypothetical protein HPB47_001569 [Ixodes persulcatus]|uniref:Uncharacterized protein n=1 Tax=Ixodes persulcatus TaxID=34615 RepID=A0AC60PP10_IXOPE|nr:hypothetical protein HPB47_001569 [Ixodes persulcatus]